MLLDIKKYLSARKTANLQELSLHFKQQPDNMRCLLAHWIRKGKISKTAKPAGCGSKCQLCKPSIAEVYQWIEAPQNNQTPQHRT